MHPIFLLAMALAAGPVDPPQPATGVEEAGLRRLLTIQRIYVDQLTGGETAAQMRDIPISSMAESQLFILTENPDKANVTLRGAAEDLVFLPMCTLHKTASTRENIGSGKSANQRPVTAGVWDWAKMSRSTPPERRHEAIAAVRLVNKDGDVIWSTTQESLGAKFDGASADVADKITAKLKEDFERAWRCGKSARRHVPT
jgi:hypothetical protein